MPNRPECYALAKEMGFTKNPDNFKVSEEFDGVLIYKGEIVATKIMGSYTDSYGDYIFYDDCEIYVHGANVGIYGREVEVGGDRPGVSYKSRYAYCVGTLDGDKFVKHEKEQRDQEFE